MLNSISHSLRLLPSLLFLFTAVTSLSADAPRVVKLPPDAGYVDVTRPPYNIVPDGKTDCTEMLQAAILRERAVYLPAGVYLINDMIHFGQKEAEAKYRMIQGEGRDRTIIRLIDNSPDFQDPARPKAVIRCASRDDLHGPANAFRNSIYDLTVETGKGNPGAYGIFYYAHNQGTLENVRIVDQSNGPDSVGLDLYRGLVGPCLITNVTIEGFDYGIRVRGPVRQITFDTIHLSKQRKFGFYNNANILAVHRLRSNNNVPAVHNRDSWGLISLVDAELTGGDPGTAAIENPVGFMMLSGIRTEGYGQIYTGMGGDRPGGTLDFLSSHPATGLFPATGKPLGLPVEETPEPAWQNPADWVAVANDPDKNTYIDHRGKERTYNDYSRAIQTAIDSGAKTVYFPPLFRPESKRRSFQEEWILSLRSLFGNALLDRIVEENKSALPEDQQNDRTVLRTLRQENARSANHFAYLFVGRLESQLKESASELPAPDYFNKEIAADMQDALVAELLAAVKADLTDEEADRLAALPGITGKAAQNMHAYAQAQAKELPPLRREESYEISTPIRIRGKVERIFGGEQRFIQRTPGEEPLFIFEDGDAPVVVMERFATNRKPHGPPNLLVDTTRTVVIKNAIPEQGLLTTDKPGRVFIQDVCGSPFHFKNKDVWIRHINPEIPEVKLLNDGGTMWIMGYKSERAGVPLKTINGGKTELYGAMFYSTTAHKEEPAVVIENSRFFGSMAESCHNGYPFLRVVNETRDGETRELEHDTLWQRDGWGFALPAYSASPGPDARQLPLPDNTKPNRLIVDFTVLNDSKPKPDAPRGNADRWQVEPRVMEDSVLQVNRQFILHEVPEDLEDAEWVRVNPESYRDWPADQPVATFTAGDDLTVYLDEKQEGFEPAGQVARTVYDYNLPRREPLYAKIAIQDRKLYSRSYAKGDTVALLPGFILLLVDDQEQ